MLYVGKDDASIFWDVSSSHCKQHSELVYGNLFAADFSSVVRAVDVV